MQILGKRSKVMLTAVAIAMLVAVGVSFAMWDMSAVKATNGDLSDYANAKVGDVIEFGRYYQTGKKVNDVEDAEYEKTPIEWIVVDKDERTGQLTLMSKYILACGSYFGNWYHDGIKDDYAWNYSGGTSEVGGAPYNQAYVDSTARAFLNNLERLDMGGDIFDATLGYIPSGIDSSIDGYDTTVTTQFIKGTGLLSSIGFSNKRYWTGYYTDNQGQSDLLNTSGIVRRFDKRNGRYELFYQRPINSLEYKIRPVTRGFLDVAFTNEQKSMIVPKQIAGYTGHRWPDANIVSEKSNVEGSVDKVWLPSATELNVANGVDWNDQMGNVWINPSDETGSTVFEYFKNLSGVELREKLKATRTELAIDGMAGNYSIPVYDKGTTIAKDETKISRSANTSSNYWTRSPSSYWYNGVHVVTNEGRFYAFYTDSSNIGVRPCVILKY